MASTYQREIFQQSFFGTLNLNFVAVKIKKSFIDEIALARSGLLWPVCQFSYARVTSILDRAPVTLSLLGRTTVTYEQVKELRDMLIQWLLIQALYRWRSLWTFWRQHLKITMKYCVLYLGYMKTNKNVQKYSYYLLTVHFHQFTGCKSKEAMRICISWIHHNHK